MARPPQFDPERMAKKKKLKKLSEMQKALVRWYFDPSVKFVKREAMERAGYARTTAMNNPMAVFNHPSVAAAIEERKQDLAERFAVDAEWITQKRKLLAEANVGAILAKLDEHGGDLGCLTL